MPKKDTMIKDAVILFVITLICAVILGAVYEITKDPIAQAEQAAKTTAYQKVFPGMDATEENADLSAAVASSEELIAAYPELEGSVIDEALLAKDSSGKVLGIVMTATNKKGYGGAIQFAMGVSNEGEMLGFEILSISETAGLGMKAKNDEFKSQFFGVKVNQFALTKAKIAGDVELQAISSATITSKAVTRGVNAGLKFAQSVIADKVGGLGNE